LAEIIIYIRVAQLKSYGGPRKKILEFPKVKIDVFTIKKCSFMEEKSLRHKIFGFVGQV